MEINNIKVEILSACESCEVSWTNYYVSATGNSRDQELTSKSHFLQRRLRFFNMVITPILSYACGTWTLSREDERMI